MTEYRPRAIDRRTFLRSAAIVAAGLALPRDAARAAAAIRDGAEPVSLARLRYGAALDELAATFDLTEHGGDDWVDAVLWPGDRARLERLRVPYRVLVEDLLAADITARVAEARAQAAEPSMRLTYRVLADYERDLRALAEAHPDVCRLFTLPLTTHEGRTVYGVEVAAGVATAATEGRPTSCIVGLHHAREWPSAELTMMFAEDLVTGYAAGDEEIVELLSGVRVLLVPVVNPDGFVRSRETISDFVVPLPGVTPVVASEFAYHRKNLRKHTAGAVEFGQGVDPNRNYPYLWGGPGTSTSRTSQVFHGPGPGSEPEVANLLALFRSNHVLTLITNHTYGDLVLRPWGHTRADPPDEAELRALADEMAAHNGYRSIKGIDLYPTTGTTEEWLYGTCGGLGYTFEIGSAGAIGAGNATPVDGAGFHPQYNLWIPRFYERNRPAFLTLVRAARDTSLHAVIAGTAPPGTEVVVRKTAVIPLDRPYGSFEWTEELESRYVVGASGSFEWHVNPSPLPRSVEALHAGTLPPWELEPYELHASLPGGKSWTGSVVVSRGGRVTLTI